MLYAIYKSINFPTKTYGKEVVAVGLGAVVRLVPEVQVQVQPV